MEPIKQAKELFPNMPDIVFDSWMAPLIKLDGWPFFSKYSDTYGTIWHQYFDGNTIESIGNLFWNRMQVTCELNSFHPSSMQVIKWTIDSHVHGIPTPVTKVKNGKGSESFSLARQLIQNATPFHTPVIFIQQPIGYQIMDGNHRVSACFSLASRFTIDAYIGS